MRNFTDIPEEEENRRTPASVTALRIVSLALVLVLAAALFALWRMQKRLREIESTRAFDLIQVEKTIEDQFVGAVDDTAMKDAAVEGMIEALNDRWSYYIPADEYKDYVNRINNQYVGIGVTAKKAVGEPITVDAVTSGGPAEAAGILVGDLIYSADGTDLLPLTLDESTALIKGDEGTAVTLEVETPGSDRRTLKIERKAIDKPVVTYEMMEDNVGYIKVANFNEHCAKESIAAISDLVSQGAAGLIFDMRFDGGGRLQEMLTLLDYILPEGEIFFSRDRDGNETSYSSDTSCIDLPMVTLVNSETYSAAEFFAAALKERAGAGIVGEPTSGKGRSQMTFRMDDGSAIAISTREYFTPDRKSLIGTGLTLDREVVLDDDDFSALYYEILAPEDDEQLIAAKELLFMKAAR